MGRIIGETTLGNYSSLFEYAKPYWRSLLIVGILMVLNSAAMLAVPWLLGHVAGGIVTREASTSGTLVALLLSSLLAIALLNSAVDYVGGYTSARIVADLRAKIHDHLARLPIGFHQANRQGNILALMTREVNTLSEFFTDTFVSVLPMTITASGAIVIMFRIDWRLGLAIPVLLPAFYAVLRIMRGPLRGLARSLQEAEADVVAAAGQNLAMLPMIKAFAREDAEAAHFRALVDRAMTIACREHRIYALMTPFIGFVAGSAAVILLVIMGRGVEAGSTAPTDMLSFLFYAALLTRPASGLARLYGKVQTAHGALARMQRVLTESPENGYSSTRHFEASAAEIRFSGVRFGYPNRGEVLRNVDLLIERGETVAIAGHNGAGKSTLISLLLRLYEPDGGAIYIDGEDIAAVNVQDLRRQIGLVSQKVFLFNGSIRDNIGYGMQSATAAQVDAAARAARAHDFIKELPQGMNTQIGDAGVFLSGGQRQRVALARALLKDPPILVLDEANSMYDLEGEAAFVEACAQSLQDRTAILITHRPATLELADRIVCLDQGIIRPER